MLVPSTKTAMVDVVLSVWSKMLFVLHFLKYYWQEALVLAGGTAFLLYLVYAFIFEASPFSAMWSWWEGLRFGGSIFGVVFGTIVFLILAAITLVLAGIGLVMFLAAVALGIGYWVAIVVSIVFIIVFLPAIVVVVGQYLNYVQSPKPVEDEVVKLMRERSMDTGKAKAYGEVLFGTFSASRKGALQSLRDKSILGDLFGWVANEHRRERMKRMQWEFEEEKRLVKGVHEFIRKKVQGRQG